MKVSLQNIGLTLVLVTCIALIASNDYLSRIASKAQPRLEEKTISVQEQFISYPYDIRSKDSLIIKSAKVKRNETLSSILTDYGISRWQINDIVEASSGIFNFKYINYRKPFHVFYSADSIPKPLYFIYEETIRDYVKVNLSEQVSVQKGRKASKFVEETFSGEIESSLYSSLSEHNLDSKTASTLAELFAWQVDFYRIQKGDSYQLILDREYIDDKPSGEFFVKAAKFNQGDESYYAFRYIENDTPMYFDENGNSLEKTFLKAPLKFSRVSSKYSKNRFHPVLKTYRAHLGTDYVAAKGTPVYAVADGVVERAGYGGNNGNYVRIRHNSIYESGYLHFSRIASGIKVGKQVRQGQVIGYVGDSGLASGVHLCYRFWKNGKQVDPYKQINPPAKPINENLARAYKAYINPLKKRLDRLHQSKDRNGTILAAI